MQKLVNTALITSFRKFCSISNTALTNGCHNFLSKSIATKPSLNYVPVQNSLLFNSKVTNLIGNIQTRSVTKFSMTKGRRQSVPDVYQRFFRLRWGIWIRTIAGRHKHLWKKSGRRKKRYVQHVFCNATQSRLLDKMAGAHFRKPRYYVNDPYEPYHSREEFLFSSRKPRPYFPPENDSL